MQYVEVHVELAAHPKTRRAAKRLGVGVPQMVGHLTLLWLWCQRYAPDGDVTGFVPDELAEGAGWEGDPNEFVWAIQNCGIGPHGVGFLEHDEESGRYVMHDWWDGGGKLQIAREAAAERQRKSRRGRAGVPLREVEMASGHGDVTVTSRARHALEYSRAEQSSGEQRETYGDAGASRVSRPSGPAPIKRIADYEAEREQVGVRVDGPAPFAPRPALAARTMAGARTRAQPHTSTGASRTRSPKARRATPAGEPARRSAPTPSGRPSTKPPAGLPSPKPPERRRDPLWDAVQTTMGYPPATTGERAKWNTALKDLREPKEGPPVTPEEWPALVAAYRQSNAPGIELTPLAVAGQLGKLRHLIAHPDAREKRPEVRRHEQRSASWRHDAGGRRGARPADVAGDQAYWQAEYDRWLAEPGRAEAHAAAVAEVAALEAAKQRAAV